MVEVQEDLNKEKFYKEYVDLMIAPASKPASEGKK
jgi:hypothetical protein